MHHNLMPKHRIKPMFLKLKKTQLDRLGAGAIAQKTPI